MSILLIHENSFLISHEKFVNQLYLNTELNEEKSESYHILPAIFDLNTSYRTQHSDQQRKIRKKHDLKAISENLVEFELIETLRAVTSQFIGHCRVNGYFTRNSLDNADNSQLKSFLDGWNSVEPIAFKQFNGGNVLPRPMLIPINGQNFLIPADCRFFNNDIKDVPKLNLNDSYDFIVIDPPWWNKYVRRTKGINSSNGYEMLDNDAIKNIPVEKLIDPSKTLVAVWCTNAPSAIDGVLKQFLPKWQLKLISSWYWIKVTKNGDPICEFNVPLKKQPFERLYIACHHECNAYDDMPMEKFIFSVPSAIHSHKPPIQELIAKYMGKPIVSISSLDIFARYLMPRSTSIGLEVLKLQNAQLFRSNQC